MGRGAKGDPVAYSFGCTKKAGKDFEAVKNDAIDTAKVAALKVMLFDNGIEEAFICHTYSIKDIKELTEIQHLQIVRNIEKFKAEYEKWKAKAS